MSEKIYLGAEMKEAADDIRLTLHRNGWRVLPTCEKRAYMKGWNSMVIDEDVIRSWSVNHKRHVGGKMVTLPANTTAIQLQGCQFALDIDVSEVDTAERIMRLVEREVEGWVDNGWIRDSGGAKWMTMFRTTEPFAQWRSPTYEDKDGVTHVVEAFGGGATRYFSCYGPHTLSEIEDGGWRVLKEYQWDNDMGPHNRTPDDLILLTTAEVYALLDKVVAEMAKTKGWKKVESYRSGDLPKKTRRDLTKDMQFLVKGGDLVDYEEALAYVATERDPRCAAWPWLEGDEGRNTERCRMSLTQEGELAIFDHGEWVYHMLEEEPVDGLTATAVLLERVLGRKVERSEAGETRDRLASLDIPAEQASYWMARWFLEEHFVYDFMTDMVYDTSVESRTRLPLKVSGQRKHWHHFSYTSWERDQPVENRAFEDWLVDSDKMVCYGVRYFPQAEGKIYVEDGTPYVNVNRGKIEPVTDAKANEVLARYLRHLIPTEEEREWFLDWLAAKWQEPWKRNCSVLMVAAGTSGVGRSTLMEIIRIMFRGHTQKVGASTLLATGGSDFNSFMEDALFVFCEEIGGIDYAGRVKAAERLKELFDPNLHRIGIKRKFVAEYDANVYASGLWATNNSNALHLQAEDRRIAVITNRDVPLLKAEDGTLHPAVYEEVGLERLAGALAWLCEHRIVTRSVNNAPHFAGREAMIEVGMTDLDDAIRAVAEDAGGTPRIWRRSDFENRVKARLGAQGGRVPGLRNAISALTGERGRRIGAILLPKREHLTSAGDKMAALVTPDLVDTFARLSFEERATMLGEHSAEAPGQVVSLGVSRARAEVPSGSARSEAVETEEENH